MIYMKIIYRNIWIIFVNIRASIAQMWVCSMFEDTKPFCLGIHTGTTGVLTSPYYPREYFTGVRCRYDITVPSGIISLRVNHLDLEPQTDYLYVSVDYCSLYKRSIYQYFLGLF